MALAGDPYEADLKEALYSLVRKYHSTEYLWRATSPDDFVDTFNQTYELDVLEVHPLIGKKVPSTGFDLILGEGKSLSDYDGVVVVDIWATWCGPCIQNMPHLQSMADRYKDKGVTVVGLSVDGNKEDVQEFFKTSPDLSYTVGWFGETGFEHFDIDAIPSVFVLDSNGIVQGYFQGFSGDEVEELLKGMLDAQ